MRTHAQLLKTPHSAPVAPGPAPLLAAPGGAHHGRPADMSRIPARAAGPARGTSAGRSDATLFRHASGPGPALAPPLVHDVLRGAGRPLPAKVQRDAEQRLGHSFADVRIHTDARAGASAQAVAANAYTVGRQIVFAPGRFEPDSAQGQRLLAHELTHAAAHPAGTPTPTGALRISSPGDAAERHASGVEHGVGAQSAPASASGLHRQVATPVVLTGVTVAPDKITVPPAAGVNVVASKAPANATGVTFALVAGTATIATGTRINATSGAITIGPGQTGGLVDAQASQTVPTANGGTQTATHHGEFNFIAIPAGITSTAATRAGVSGQYGGQFTHTFTSPGGGQAALEFAHVNERFAAGSGTTLALSGVLGAINVTTNDATLATDGWDLDASGTMVAPDNVTWSDGIDARPFVANASNRTPANRLPQALTAVQSFRNLTFPAQTYRTAAVASTTHRRAIEERGNLLKAVTSAGINQEVVDDYAGPTVFRRCRASAASIPVAATAAPGATPAAASTTTITVDAEGQAATPTFSINAPDLGCTISSAGVLTPGTTAGTVTVRAGDTSNFDETTVTLTARAAASPGPGPAPSP